jgi:hypothetical protein
VRGIVEAKTIRGLRLFAKNPEHLPDNCAAATHICFGQAHPPTGTPCNGISDAA